VASKSYKDILVFSRDAADKLVITVSPDYNWEALKSAPALALPREGEVPIAGLNPNERHKNTTNFKYTDFLKGKISESLQDEHFVNNPKLKEKFIAAELFGKRTNNGYKNKEYITEAGKALLEDFDAAGAQKRSKWDGLTQSLAPYAMKRNINGRPLKHAHAMPLHKDEIRVATLAEDLHIPYETMIVKTAKLFNALVHEEAALVQASKLADTLSASLPKDNQAYANVSKLQQALSSRAENKLYHKDIVPLIQDVASTLDARFYPEELQGLKKTMDVTNFSQLERHDPLMHQSQHPVSARFGGLRKNDKGNGDLKALTPEGVEVLLQRHPYTPKAKKENKSKDVTVQVQPIENPLFQVMNKLPKAESLPVPEIPEAFVAESGTVEQSRIGVVTHHGDGRIVHRGNYGRGA
jgi:hypothetical protein